MHNFVSLCEILNILKFMKNCKKNNLHATFGRRIFVKIEKYVKYMYFSTTL